MLRSLQEYLRSLLHNPPRRKPNRCGCRPIVEFLERRDAPAVLTVTENTDLAPMQDNPHAGQLRQTMAAASDGDTINFNLGAGNNVITLNSQINTNATNLTIDGGNANARVTITAPNSRALYFGDPGAGTLHLVSETIRYITFTNCGTGANPGVVNGAAIALVGNVQMNNCFFTGNQAANYGGAMWIESAGWNVDETTITNTQFRTNSAGEGGALYFEGDGPVGSDGVAQSGGGWITLIGDSFTQNSATAGGGGAVLTGDPYCAINTFTVTDCMFQNNTASGEGGAIYTSYPLTVSADTTVSEFSNNTAGSTGGAIYWTSGTGTLDTSITLTNLTFGSSALTADGKNSAAAGGAVALTANMTSGTATETITGCLFNGNQATDGGGGGLLVSNTTSDGAAVAAPVATDTAAKTEIADSTDETSLVATLDSTDTTKLVATLASTDTTKLVATPPPSTGNATLNVTNSTFYQNSATFGGGIVIANTNNGTGANTATLTSLTVYSNSATGGGLDGKGGGLWVDAPADAGRVRINNSIFAGNSANRGLDVYGTAILSQRFNFIGSSDDSQGCWNASDYTGTDAAQLDPGLGALSDKGGKTMVIDVPITNTAVRRLGNPALWGTLDQRGRTRNGVDPNNADTKYVTIGAYDPDAT